MVIRTATMTIVRGVSWLLVANWAFALNGPVRADGWNYLNGVHGRGYVICDAVLKRLNGYEWTEESANDEGGTYVSSVVLSYPGWKEPPWQELDPREHRDLVRELLKYNYMGADAYFGRKKPRPDDAYMELMERSIEANMTLDHRLRVWRTHLINWLDDKPAPPGDQTVVNLSFPSSAEELERLQKKHPDKPVVQGPGLVFLVTDDLRGPDPRVSEWHARWISPVLLFNGKPHFGGAIATGWTVSISRDFGSGPRSFCELQYDLTP